MDEILKKYRVVPVVVIQKIEDTISTLGALCEGGLPVAEITFRTECASDAIALGRKHYPRMYIGAGTVINKEQAQKAINAGAMFIVSPGFSNEVANICKVNYIPYIPGCVTPVEIMQAIDAGIDVVKFFPANVYGGMKAISALSAPFPQIRFLPTGGIDLSNISEYLSCDRIAAVGGSFMMKGNISDNCKKLMEVIHR